MAVAEHSDLRDWDFCTQTNTHEATIVASKYFVTYLKK